MIAQTELEFALSIQERSYKLLIWLGKAIGEGFVPFTKAHDVMDAGQAAKGWMETHFYNLPLDCRPFPDEIESFANFFGTFLETSFDIDAHPRNRYASGCGCFCPTCCRLANPQNLKPKSLTPKDKSRAAKLRLRRVETLSLEEGVPFYESRVRSMVGDEIVRRQASLSAYGAAMLDRIKGFSDGPAVLVLWRDFAWNPNGSPQRNFKLRTNHILDAESHLIRLLKS